MTQRLDQLRKLYEADADDPFLTYGIALEHSKAGEDEQALEWLNKTLDLDEHYHYAWYQKGRVLGAMGRDAEARETLQTGLNKAEAAGDAKASGELAELLASMSG